MYFRNYYLELCNASLDKLFLKDGDPKKYLRPMPPPEEVLRQLALGLEYIHKEGFIHRNIKPENVLIWENSKNGQVLMKWADFGLSKPVNERGTFTVSDIKGSDQWLAPELLELLDNEDFQDESEEEQRGTIQTDVFAEGLVFGYYLMGGVHLYGSKLFDISNNIKDNKPVNLDGKSKFGA
jgi:serine/threonine-protein kinase/endoribonuclease IRE1